MEPPREFELTSRDCRVLRVPREDGSDPNSPADDASIDDTDPPPLQVTPDQDEVDPLHTGGEATLFTHTHVIVLPPPPLTAFLKSHITAF